MKYWLPIIIILGWSCEDNPERVKELKTEMVVDRVSDYIRSRRENCRRELLLEADRQVDSMLIAEAYFNKIDTSRKPLKPDRPPPPERRMPRDSTPLGPLWDSKRIDSDSIE